MLLTLAEACAKPDLLAPLRSSRGDCRRAEDMARQQADPADVDWLIGRIRAAADPRGLLH